MEAARLDLSSLKVLPIFIFAFTCHQNIFACWNELSRPSIPRIDTVIVTAGTMICLINLVIGLGAFFTYGSLLDKDVLETYPSSPIITAVRILMSLLVTLTYPRKSSAGR
jgi:amino acid permease